MRRAVFAMCVLVIAVPLYAGVQVPASVSAEATGPGGAVVTYSASADGTGTGDDENGRPLDGPGTVNCLPASGSTFPVGTTEVTCSATSSTGTISETFPVIVTDTTAPVLHLPVNINVNASSANGALVSYTANAHDLVDGLRGASCTPGPGLFSIGTTTVNCTASDSRGNQSSGSFTVVVTALPPPQINVPDDMTVEATSAAGAQVTFSVNGHYGGAGGGDDENGRPISGITVSCSPASGSTFPLGTTTVQCTATDNTGSSSDSFTVTVVDTTGPAIDLPRSFTVAGTSANGAVVTYNASATDLVDGSVAVNCSPASGSTFPVGTTAVNCSASDSRGNSAHGGFDVTVTAPDDPPSPPQLNLPGDITAEASGPSGAIVTFVVTTSGPNGGDDENGRPTSNGVTCSPASGSQFALGTTTVQCTAGNLSGSFKVTVVDTTAPALTLPANITTDEPNVFFSATATDLVDGSVSLSCTPPSGSTFATGTTTVNCSASDTRGNTATGSFTVTVTDDPPARVIIVTASPSTLWPPDHKMVPVTINVSISDGSSFTASIFAVASNEENDPNDHTSPDWVITGPLTLELRAEKNSQGQPRIYTIHVEIVDDANVTHLEQIQVSVDGPSKAPNATRLRTRKG